jgi:hypothetical protein
MTAAWLLASSDNDSTFYPRGTISSEWGAGRDNARYRYPRDIRFCASGLVVRIACGLNGWSQQPRRTSLMVS